MNTIPSESIEAVRAALMASLANASHEGDRGAWRAYRRALAAVGCVGVRAVAVDIEIHGPAMRAALDLRARAARDEIEATTTTPQQRRAAYGRQLHAETTIAELGLDESPMELCGLDHHRIRIVADRRRARRR
jgi:hypothetical protein